MSKVRTFRKGKALDIFTSYLFVLPVILGILLFTLVPMMTSLYYSFTDYNPTLVNAKPAFVGIQNFADAFGKNWKAVGNSLFVTISYTIITVPLNLVLSFAIAMLLNQKLKGMRVFRTIYYIPVIIPAVASGLLWNDITKVNGGMFNVILTEFLKLPPYQFYNSAETVLPSLIFMSLFGMGGGMVLWIAQLKGIPESLYEAASLDGANFFVRTFRITLPMCTPMIFYNLIMGIIGGLQIFTQVLLLRNPNNSEALNFFVLHIYDNAMGNNMMGYASALSWILFVIIAAITAVTFKTSKWVYYGEVA
ncbi:sugar ABC transporter permease [Candidatus Borkfalkia ceftriaxoniphila]|uniref:Sugar ABC transporter permease n=1 Tax=Candidatus Borkfalkia ceftriaxoniphila TaxID=2508949 RepID=A0A4Q2K8V7_9FIRM|nr:sugar ABC transporter permease [Candidatus Borkfalkia ceftriaxoniphila]RXZ61025.1 sugar ABC transporter permease [Candidatus Borkfalkia ceftriaxoniphila]